MKFNQAMALGEARTENGMKTLASSASNCVDLFGAIGALRGKDAVTPFVKALTENTDYALRIAQWARDVRGGAGERQVFRDILAYLAKNDVLKASAMLKKVPELGRWDDLWSVFGINEKLDKQIVDMIAEELEKGNGLLAKWLPRQKEVINGKDLVKALREKLRLTPAEYRKLVVRNTHVVEQFMCAKNWEAIDFSKIPSLAHSRYKKAFYKNADSYKTYIEKLVSGDKSVKINAGAVYPYDVIKAGGRSAETDAVMQAQWDALPDYLEDNSVLPIIDTSDSMTWFQVAPNLTPRDVAFSLGLYVADKLKGDFKGCAMTFDSRPQLVKLSGKLTDKLNQIRGMRVGGSTNLHASIQLILDTAIKGNVAPEDMPKTLLIFTDMQFNSCTQHNDSAMEMIERKYRDAGYEVPTIVFWNMDARHAGKQSPVAFNKKGVALVSGFSPAILRSVLAAKVVTPEQVMLDTIMNERYDLVY